MPPGAAAAAGACASCESAPATRGTWEDSVASPPAFVMLKSPAVNRGPAAARPDGAVPPPARPPAPAPLRPGLRPTPAPLPALPSAPLRHSSAATRAPRTAPGAPTEAAMLLERVRAGSEKAAELCPFPRSPGEGWDAQIFASPRGGAGSRSGSPGSSGPSRFALPGHRRGRGRGWLPGRVSAPTAPGAPSWSIPPFHSPSRSLLPRPQHQRPIRCPRTSTAPRSLQDPLWVPSGLDRDSPPAPRGNAKAAPGSPPAPAPAGALTCAAERRLLPRGPTALRATRAGTKGAVSPRGFAPDDGRPPRQPVRLRPGFSHFWKNSH